MLCKHDRISERRQSANALFSFKLAASKSSSKTLALAHLPTWPVALAAVSSTKPVQPWNLHYLASGLGFNKATAAKAVATSSEPGSLASSRRGIHGRDATPAWNMAIATGSAMALPARSWRKE